MLYEPDTVWGRTVDGDSEIAKPKSGLSLTQRRLLKRLEHPRSFAAFAAQNRLPPPKLEHELMALAQLRLVAFQRPGSPRPRTAPSINLPLPAASATPVDTIAKTQPEASKPKAPPAVSPARIAQAKSLGTSPQTISIAILLPLCVAAAALGIASVLLILG